MHNANPDAVRRALGRALVERIESGLSEELPDAGSRKGSTSAPIAAFGSEA
jgi:hypothetical protein